MRQINYLVELSNSSPRPPPGSCASTNPAEWQLCPYDHADWQFTQNDQEAAPEGLPRTTEIWGYGELLPTKYTAWRLPAWWRRQVTDQFRAHGVIYLSPFNGEPESAQMAKQIYRNLPTYGPAKPAWCLGVFDERNCY
jgi:hypothetical protein